MDHLRSGVQDQLDQYGETPSLLKINQTWWCTPVIPATQKAEAAELLEPKKQRLQLAEITGISAWATKAKLHLKKEKNLICITYIILNIFHLSKNKVKLF